MFLDILRNCCIRYQFPRNKNETIAELGVNEVGCCSDALVYVQIFTRDQDESADNLMRRQF